MGTPIYEAWALTEMQSVGLSTLHVQMKCFPFKGGTLLTDTVKTLHGLGMLGVSVVAVGARVQWFKGSVVQRRV